MQGGREEPCISFDSLKDLQERSGQLCPLVELEPSNRAAAELALAAIRLGADNPLWSRMFDFLTEGADAEDRRDLFYRVLAAVSDPGIAVRVERLRKEPRK
jgi:hypothetical protein